MAITDIITLACSAFCIYRGARRGFLGSVLAPLALILGTVVSVIYYLLTKDIPISLFIGLLGPFLLLWIFRIFLRSWNKVTNPDKKISTASRIGGAVLTLTWCLVMIIVTVLLLALIPPVNELFRVLYRDIHKSGLYYVIKPLDTYGVSKASPEENLEALSKDQRILDIVNDPINNDAIARRDYPALMSNPKIMALTQDPEMLKKMMTIYRQIGEPQQLPK